MLSDPTEGVFFVVRLPTGWQLCTCRHDESGPLGLPDFWVEVLSPFLDIWISHMLEHDPANADERHSILERALGLVVAGYDAFPRGEVKWSPSQKRYTVRHGKDFTREMRVSRREVEEAFSIRGKATWTVDETFNCHPDSAQRMRGLLGIDQKWAVRPARKTAAKESNPQK